MYFDHEINENLKKKSKSRCSGFLFNKLLFWIPNVVKTNKLIKKKVMTSYNFSNEGQTEYASKVT